MAISGFPCGSAGKESACNAGDLGLIPGLGRFPWRRERLPTLEMAISIAHMTWLLEQISGFFFFLRLKYVLVLEVVAMAIRQENEI